MNYAKVTSKKSIGAGFEAAVENNYRIPATRNWVLDLDQIDFYAHVHPALIILDAVLIW